jgi:hypothetical protein
VLERIRIGVLGLCLFASVVACDRSDSGLLSSASPVSTTTTTMAVASAYRPENPGPVAAVERFLNLEIAGDFEASFDLLSQADQEAAGGAEGWVAEHYLVVPTIRGFHLTADTADGTRAEVSAGLSLQAELDQLVGLIPGDADATWVVLEEGDEWRVAFTESRIDPVFPDDATAPAAVAGWGSRRQSCLPEEEGDLALLGFPTLADPLCGSTGRVTVSGPSPLEDAADAAPFLAAFGPEVGIWARVVEVQTPIALRVVVAPIGERWVVIGVLEP